MESKFVEYCWSFYAPHEICGHLFQNTLEKQELEVAVRLLVSLPRDVREFCGDSFDRELVRDIMLKRRGVTATEYKVENIFLKCLTAVHC